MDSKKDAPQLSKAERETKRKANSFRRDPLTQTKLKSFFKKSSEASSDNNPHDSDDDGSGFVTDENNEDTKNSDDNDFHVNSNDTTLKLKDIKDTDDDTGDDHATTVKSEENISKYTSGKDSKTFVINITLQGIPKHKDTSNVKNEQDIENNEKQNDETKIKQEIDRKLHKGKKEKPPSKRKIKALFGESSDSDGETRSPKKLKTHRDKSDRKHKHSKKNSAKESNKQNHKKHDISTESTSLFHQSDEESEKELVIDDGTDLKISKSAEDTLIISDIQTDQVETNTINSDHMKNDNDTSLQDNKSSSSLDHMRSDDANYNKARKLSLEADAVLQQLQMFKDLPPESAPPEIMPDIEQIEALVTIKSSPIPSKHKDKDKHHHMTKNKLSLGKKIKDERKTKEGKSEKHKTDKTHRKESKHRSKNDANNEPTTKKTEKVDLAGLVVKLLMPYYKKKKISSRDLFKTTARHIVHQLLAIQVTGKSEQ